MWTIRLVRRLTVFAALALAPTAAWGHEGLRRSSPAKDALLSNVPSSLRLTFNAPDLRFTRIQLLDPANASVPLGDLRLDSARIVVADIRGPLRAGRYTVVWQVAGADGHPVRGQFFFSIASGASGIADTARGHIGGEAGASVPAPGAATTPAEHHVMDPGATTTAFDAESPLYVVVRWTTFLVLLVIIGVVAFQALVLRLFARRASALTTAQMTAWAGGRAGAIGAIAAAVLLVAALARLVAQSYAMHAGSASLDIGLLTTMITQTIWGWGWILQIGAAILAIIVFRAMRQHRAWAFSGAIIATVALAMTPALSGHAASVPSLKPLAIGTDTLHVLGAGGWLGSLLIVLIVGIPSVMRLPPDHRGRAVADLVNAFSPTALLFAGIVAVTGVVSAWLHLESVSAVWTSTYGRVLLLKLAALSVVAATGAYNWLRVRPALGGPEGAARIRRSSTIEVAVGAVVLLVTAVLVATPTPMDMTMGGE